MERGFAHRASISEHRLSFNQEQINYRTGTDQKNYCWQLDGGSLSPIQPLSSWFEFMTDSFAHPVHLDMQSTISISPLIDLFLPPTNYTHIWHFHFNIFWVNKSCCNSFCQIKKTNQISFVLKQMPW